MAASTPGTIVGVIRRLVGLGRMDLPVTATAAIGQVGVFPLPVRHRCLGPATGS